MSTGTPTAGPQAGDRAEQTAQHTAERAQEQSGDLTSQAQERAQQAAGQAKNRLREQLDQRSSQAAEQINQHASDFRAVGASLREQGKDGPAKAADKLAEYAEKAGGYLRDRDSDALLADAEDYGRRQPWAVAAGGLALGFAASRFLKASARERYSGGSSERTTTPSNGSARTSSPTAPTAPAAPAAPAVPPAAAAPPVPPPASRGI
jgi:hypothetical protein